MAAGQVISFYSGTAVLEGYLVRPEGEGPFPAVVVIHEIFGLNENIRDIAHRFAGEGYMALAVDLFSRGSRLGCVMRVVGDLLLKTPETSNGVRDLKAALDYLTEQPGVDSDRIGAIGFCMGGSYAVAWACADERIKVIAPYYGFNPRPLDAVARACAVVGSYPGKDITTKQGQKLEEALTLYNIPHDIKIYPEEAKHSFFNDKGPTYNPTVATDSWQRVTTFFKEKLG